MRQIEKQMVEAVENGKTWMKSNTEVVVKNGVTSVYLWGNKIAWKTANGKWNFDTCGWNTQTTRNRLNALGANCRIKNGTIIFA